MGFFHPKKVWFFKARGHKQALFQGRWDHHSQKGHQQKSPHVSFVIIALCRVCMKVEVQQHDTSICVVLVVICVISQNFFNLLVRILYCLRIFGIFVLFEVIWPLAMFGCVGIPKVSPETFNIPRMDTSRRILGGTKNTMVGWVVFRGWNPTPFLSGIILQLSHFFWGGGNNILIYYIPIMSFHVFF